MFQNDHCLIKWICYLNDGLFKNSQVLYEYFGSRIDGHSINFVGKVENVRLVSIDSFKL